MEQKPKRKRIEPKQLTPAIKDELAFVENKATAKARKIGEFSLQFDYDIYFDKHYLDRHQHGDDLGKRDGIDTHLVEKLVNAGIEPLIFFSALIKNVTFVNQAGMKGNRATRVVLQEDINGTMLNVVIEAHYYNPGYYEITVKTAICKDDYEPSDGQYAIEINGDSYTLRKFENFKLREIAKV